MGAPTEHDITQVLADAAAGDDAAAVRLLPLVYDELRKLAAGMMARTPPGNTLQATALVHEAYLRVGGDLDPAWDGRRHFFFAASRAMRDIIVEQARRKGSRKHGGGRRREGDPDLVPIEIDEPAGDVLQLDQALRRLEAQEPDVAHVVMLRYFSGLSTDEMAAVLSVSDRTVKRRWRYARVWLQDAMNAGDADNARKDADGG